MYVYNNMRYWIRYVLLIVRNEFYPVWVLRCLISYLSYFFPAAFVSSVLYHVLIES